MPYHLVQVGRKWQVVDAKGKRHAKGTTRAKAVAQMRLLYSIENKKKGQ